MTETIDIKGTRDRARFLKGRVEALRAQLADATTSETSAQAKLQAAKEGLADGTTNSDDVARWARAFDDAAGLKSHVAEALAAVTKEHGAVMAEIDTHDNREERSRQNAAAEPFRRREKESLHKFAANVALLRLPLIEAAELCRQIGREYPLAEPVAPVTMGQLATLLREQFHGVLSVDTRPEYNDRYERYLDRVLGGPLPDMTEFNEFKKTARIVG